MTMVAVNLDYQDPEYKKKYNSFVSEVKKQKIDFKDFDGTHLLKNVFQLVSYLQINISKKTI